MSKYIVQSITVTKIFHKFSISAGLKIGNDDSMDNFTLYRDEACKQVNYLNRSNKQLKFQWAFQTPMNAKTLCHLLSYLWR